MHVNDPRPLTRSQRLVLSLLSSEWMTGPDLAAAVRSYLRATGRQADATPQGVHRTVASLAARGYVEKYRVHGVVRFRAVPAANRGPDRVLTESR